MGIKFDVHIISTIQRNLRTESVEIEAKPSIFTVAIIVPRVLFLISVDDNRTIWGELSSSM